MPRSRAARTTATRNFLRKRFRGSIETLETRLALNADYAHINFQPAAAAVPAGYLADAGATYAFRGNGLTYGWSVDVSATALDRNNPISPDQRYDTLVSMQTGGNATWEIAVPNGRYEVHVVMGDPSAIDSVYGVSVEGMLTATGTPSVANHWIEGTVFAQVADGRLTIANGPGSVNDKIAYVDIKTVSQPGAIVANDLTQGGTATSDPANSPTGEEPPKAFDNTSATKFLAFDNPAAGDPTYLVYDFASTNGFAVNRYTITSANDAAGRDPRDFELQGSNNGTTWTAVDSRTNVFFFGRFETQSFVTANVAAFQMYRLAVSETWNTGQGEVQLSELQLFEDVPQPPVAPTALSTSTVSTNAVQLNWNDNAGNETSYKIERKTGVAGTYQEVTQVGANSTSYMDNVGLLAGVQYYYRVRASNAVGNSAYSSEAIGTTAVPTVTVNSLATGDRTPALTGTVDDATATVLVTVGAQQLAATNNGNGTWTLANNALAPLTAGVYNVAVQAADPGGASGADATTNELTIYSSVVGRKVFYNNSAFDSAASGKTDNDAIASDKQPLLPGGAAAFVNYTNYDLGLNGVMVDLDGVANPGSLTVNDFLFRVGNSNATDSWTAAPVPALSIGSGPNGSTRVKLIWSDNAIRNQWLQVVVKANAATGLVAPDVFYFGNAVGDTGIGNSPGFATVGPADELAARSNPRTMLDPAPIDFAYDFNRDQLVGPQDQMIVHNNGATNLTALRLISPVAATPAVSIVAVDAAASEGGANVATFQVTRTGLAAGPLVVQYTTSGTATNGVDYVLLSGTVAIPVDQMSATITVTPLDDLPFEGNETVTLTLVDTASYDVTGAGNAGATIADNDTNNPPLAPVISEPLTEGQNVSGFDVHMEIEPFQDIDPGQNRLNSDWELRLPDGVTVAWFAHAKTGDADHHIHFGDGQFTGPQAGKNKLEPSTNYQLWVRTRDNSGDLVTNTSAWSVRNFHTLPEETPTAPGWVARQAGYVVEEVPFTFAPGETDWRLPTNIAFVPENLRGPHPNDPLFYVVELYGSIRVVTNNYTVYTYATGLLNYNPTGPISGTGENGLTGLAIDPTNGDLYVSMLYDDLSDGSSDKFPKVTRLISSAVGLSVASQIDILKMPGESMLQSHIISNVSFGPDDKLYVHVGEGFDASQARNDFSFRGKILRMNRDGSAPTDNPHYNPVDRNNDSLPDAEDYWYAEGFRNPFGGAWRDPDPSVSRPAQHFTVENGPGRDRFSMLVAGRDYLWDGSDTSMQNFNIAYSASGGFENGIDDWNPAPAPVNITFIQESAFNNSGFPADKWGHAFVTLSGPTHASGPNFSKSIQEWVLNNDGTRMVPAAGQQNPRELASYEGSGYATAAGIAPGPDGLYFSTLYPDADANPLNPGAKIFRIRYVGAAGAGVGQSALDTSEQGLVESAAAQQSAIDLQVAQINWAIATQARTSTEVALLSDRLPHSVAWAADVVGKRAERASDVWAGFHDNGPESSAMPSMALRGTAPGATLRANQLDRGRIERATDLALRSFQIDRWSDWYGDAR